MDALKKGKYNCDDKTHNTFERFTFEKDREGWELMNKLNQ